MTADARRVLRVLVDDGVRKAIRETGRNPLEGKAAVDDDLQGRRFTNPPMQRPGKYGVFVAYFEYEGAPIE